MRQSLNFSLPSDFSIENFLLNAGKFSPVVLLNSNQSSQATSDPYGKFKMISAIGSIEELIRQENSFSSLQNFIDKKDWHFGYFTFDLKNQLENLSSSNHDFIGFPVLHFFRPRWVLIFFDDAIRVEYDSKIDSEESTIEHIKQLTEKYQEDKTTPPPVLKAKVSKEQYISNVENIQKHIQRGDIYEMNYCVEFFSENTDISPAHVYQELNQVSPMPFSCYYQMEEHYLMCASPERFLAKRGNKIISQPIKGTAKRGQNEEEDKNIIEALRNNPKEQSENVMIVDLVRNDLSRTAAKGSVKVEELFGIYTFRQLHQMISTVCSELKSGLEGLDAIRAAFPMGSMTGAPKIRAMQLIDEFESTKRGLYSGAVGYFDPNGDFDFNVVIRSIQYNRKNKYLNFMVGSAITISSDPQFEYTECLLKAEGMMKALRQSL